VLTRLLIAMNIVAYAWEYFSGALDSDATLTSHGALLGTRVLENGEWWRIFSAGFLHGGAMHILFNMFALWQVGHLTELIFGAPRMAFIYFFSMLTSGLLVTAIDPSDPTIGASGAIFGLFGALAAAGLRLGKPGRDLVRQCVGIIVLNLIISYTLPNISKSGHIGGLIGGFVTGIALFRRRPSQPAAAAVYAAVTPVDLRHDPGVTTIEHPTESPHAVTGEYEPPPA
jgi:rhomboid protease GluP